MRRTFFKSLPLILSIAAFGAVPAAASASATLAVNGVPLEEGAMLKGTSTNSKFGHPGGTFECSRVEFTAEVIENGFGEPGPAVAELPGYLDFESRCFNNGTGGYLTVQEESFEIGVGQENQIFFFSEEVADFDSTRLDFIWGWNESYAFGPCEANGSGNQKWSPGNQTTPAELSFVQTFAVAPEVMCPQQMAFSGSFQLTDQFDNPVEILE